MNNIRRENLPDFEEKTQSLKTWLYRRADFLDSYSADPDAYCKVIFRFSWGNLSHYVLRGQELGYLPLPEYGEHQTPGQEKKNRIIGWADEDGVEISPDLSIDRDRVFTPIPASGD